MAPVPERLANGPAAAVWQYFYRLCDFPRPSGQEDAVQQWLLNLAREQNWPAHRDAAGNVVISVSGRGNRRREPILILQGHTDMIGEKAPGIDHDFTRDPIRPALDGDWLHAHGTTLGADNGIGVALALAAASIVADDRIPLELVFTVDEETGLTGAMNLDAGLLRGRRLLNLDSEEDGTLTVGCAGGIDLQARFELGPVATVEGAWSFTIDGLAGGHSGMDIDKGRLNAIQLAVGILDDLHRQNSEAVVHRLHGGTRKNAIPRRCRVIVSGVTGMEIETVCEAALAMARQREPGATISVEPLPGAEELPVVRWPTIQFVQRAPLGVLAMDPAFTDVVRSSNSLGVSRGTSRLQVFTLHARSSCNEERQDIVSRVGEVARALGGNCNASKAYPGWTPNPASDLLRLGAATWREVTGEDPAIQAIHAGLEAGIIGAALGTDELLAVGPTIENAHSPRERLNVVSLERVWTWLRRLVTKPQTDMGGW